MPCRVLIETTQETGLRSQNGLDLESGVKKENKTCLHLSPPYMEITTIQ